MSAWALRVLPRFAFQALAGLLLALYLVAQVGLGGVEWGSPWAFLLAVPVLLLPLQPTLTGVNVLAVPRSGPRRWTLRLLLAWVPDVLRVASLLLLVVALARPRITHREVIVESDGLDILLAIDTSGSMREEDLAVSMGGYASRLAVAKGVVAEFVALRPYDRIGVVVFGEEAFTHVPLTLDHDTLVNVLDTVEIGIAGSRGTAVGTAIAVSAKRLKELEAPERIVILLTDGRSNAGRLSPLDAAKAAKALDIRIYTIGVGAPSRGFPGFGDGIDEPMMREVAQLTGGRYFRATDARSLKEVYATIDELETSPAEVEEIVQHEERFRLALIPGAFLLALQALLGATIFRRGP